MERLGGQEGPRVPQAEITSLVADLVESLLSRNASDAFRPEDVGNGAWVLARIDVPPDVFTKVFESHPDMGQVRQAEITYVVEAGDANQTVHVDVTSQAETIFRSQHCSKLELWEFFLTGDQDSTVYQEYSKDGHVIPMSEDFKDPTDPLTISKELSRRFRFVTQDDMRHLRQLGEWLHA